MQLSRRRPSVVRTALVTAVALAALTTVTVTGAASPAGAAGCHVTWGSLAKTAPTMTQAPVVAARAGRHACFDRFVIELAGNPAPGWNVRYVANATEDGSGNIVPLRGGAKIQVTVKAPAYNSDGQATYKPANRREAVSVAGFRTFRQVAYLGSFEGTSDFGLGVRARLPFRTLVMPGPGGHSRLVVDVAHSWV
ncbi:MAG: hypothetical protein JWM47_577 [Acidimicrobiales bacterium]|nr:hypothetical protein [Acidimicrobiales bacterium]